MLVYMDISLLVAVDGKKKVIDKEIQEICASVNIVEDHHILDHTLATLTQLSRSLQTHLDRNDKNNSEFPIKDHFAPSQKNEKQLTFTRTTAPAGRKKKDLKLL